MRILSITTFFVLIISIENSFSMPNKIPAIDRLKCVQRSLDHLIEYRTSRKTKTKFVVSKEEASDLTKSSEVKSFIKKYKFSHGEDLGKEKITKLNKKFIKKAKHDSDELLYTIRTSEENWKKSSHLKKSLKNSSKKWPQAPPKSPRVERQFYSVIENSILKELNDKIIQNKELVTSIDNFFKHKFREHLNNGEFPLLKKAISGGNIDLYHDFKSIKLRYNGNKNQELLKELENLLDITTNDLIKELKQIHLESLYEHARGLAGSPKNWYMIGTGHTHDQAAASARVARSKFRPKSTKWVGILDFKEAKKVFRTSYTEIKKTLKAFESSYSKPKYKLLFDKEDDLPPIPKVELVAILRKNSGKNYVDKINNLQKDIQNFFKIKITEKEAIALESFYLDIDKFSPSLLIKERVSLDYAKRAKAGVLSFDIQAQGAYNNYEIMKEFAKVGNKKYIKSVDPKISDIYKSQTVENLVEIARIAERRSTRTMKEVENDVVNILDSFFKDLDYKTTKEEIKNMILRTGDDINVFLPEQFLKKSNGKIPDEYFRNLSHIISNSKARKRLRNVNIPYFYKDGTTPIEVDQISNLITKGELAHKQIQEKIARKYLSLKELKNLSITVNVKPQSLGKARLQIFIKGVDSDKVRKITNDLRQYIKSSEDMSGITTHTLKEL